MTKTKWTEIKGDDDGCFACGQDNPHGLKMKFETDGEKLRCGILLPPQFKGWKNLVHGGILSTLIDESMAWAAAYLNKRFILTRSIQVRFRKPVEIEKPLWVYSYVLNRRSDDSVTMQADIFDDTGAVCVSGTGEFALFTSEQILTLELMDPRQVERMEQRFRDAP